MLTDGADLASKEIHDIIDHYTNKAQEERDKANKEIE